MKKRDKRLEYPHDGVIKVLEQKVTSDWKKIKHIGSDTGIDLTLAKDDRMVVIEAEGEREKSKNVKGRVKMALGAIIMDMNKEETGKVYRYCIALPDTEAFKECKIPARPRQQLGLNIIFVDCPTGLLKVLLPDGKDTKEAINFSSFDKLF